MKPKLTNALRGVKIGLKSKEIERVHGTNFFKLGELKMGGFPGEVFAIVVDATNGKVHVEEVLQQYNTSSHKMDLHLVYVTDEQQWEMLVDAAYRNGLLDEKRLHTVMREAHRLGIPINREQMSWKSLEFEKPRGQECQ
jgi:hypothetical protein